MQNRPLSHARQAQAAISMIAKSTRTAALPGSAPGWIRRTLARCWPPARAAALPKRTTNGDNTGGSSLGTGWATHCPPGCWVPGGTPIAPISGNVRNPPQSQRSGNRPGKPTQHRPGQTRATARHGLARSTTPNGPSSTATPGCAPAGQVLATSQGTGHRTRSSASVWPRLATSTPGKGAKAPAKQEEKKGGAL